MSENETKNLNEQTNPIPVVRPGGAMSRRKLNELNKKTETEKTEQGG